LKVLIVILNYKVADLVINSLSALEPEITQLPETSVVVVDNASNDQSVERIRNAIDGNNWSSWASVLPSDYNGGYSSGNNLALREALKEPNPPELFHLLNPDTKIRPDAVRVLVDFLEQNPTVGLAGGMIEGPDGSLFQCANKFPNILSELDNTLRLGLISKLVSPWTKVQRNGDDPCETDWVPGVSLMIRREVFESIGLMDEEYFLYYEETDFCLHAKRKGWSCWYVPKSQVLHFSGSSTGVTGKKNRFNRLPDYWFESRQRYFVKNHGWIYAACADLIWICGIILWKIRRVIQQKKVIDPPLMLWDFVRNCVFVTGFKALWTKVRPRPPDNKIYEG
jgi:GT2 family glycosyltransferase